MNRSPLHDQHLALKARMLPFAGWEMPIQYEGIVAEHKAVRSKVGVFDISHMGEFIVSGRQSAAALNGVLTNDVAALAVGTGHYTLMLNEDGGVIDDLLLYRSGEEEFFLVVNASKVEEDFAWLQQHLGEEVALANASAQLGALAVQGPETLSVWDSLEPEKELPSRNEYRDFGDGLIVCRTGYTGEDGFELFAPVDDITVWWKRLLSHGVVPCGLGARDTLRLEKGYPLNGSDLDSTRSPLSAGLGFFVKQDKPEGFIGSKALQREAAAAGTEMLTALRMTGKAPPPRHDYEVRDETGERTLGKLTSGSLSPSLGLGIGMAYLPCDFTEIGTPVTIMIRDRSFPAEVVKKPFV